MALRMRLARGGAKHHPFYRLVVAQNTSPRDGRFVEKLGYYDPMVSRDSENRFVINEERTRYWLSVGVKPSDRVTKLLAYKKLVAMPEIHETPKKSAPKKKAQERLAKAAGGAE